MEGAAGATPNAATANVVMASVKLPTVVRG
jgi:hypothetical protein